MSRFFSEKYLKYRGMMSPVGSVGASAGGVITTDQACLACGYNLRGLPVGRRCPECGADQEELSRSFSGGAGGESFARRRALIDILGSGDVAHRARWRRGIVIASTCAILALIARISAFAIQIRGPIDEVRYATVFAGAAVALLWMIGVLMLLPHELLNVWPHLRRLRAAVLYTQPLWLIGYITWAMALTIPVSLTVESLLIGASLLCHAMALAGTAAFIALLTFISEEAEVERASMRLNMAMWMLPLSSIVSWAALSFLPAGIPPSADGPMILIYVILMLPTVFALAWWCWSMAIFVIGLRGLTGHIRWVGRHHEELRTRQERINERKREIEAQVAAKIRPLPPPHPG